MSAHRSTVTLGPAPPPPEQAREVFGAALPGAERFASWLAGAGVARGLLGPREVPRLWERHLLNCALVVSAVDQTLAATPPTRVTPGSSPVDVVDIGSGAGLPGVVLALLRPQLSVLLLEPLARRVQFLREVCEDLRLSSVTIRGCRAQAAAGTVSASVATARAVAPLSSLCSWSGPLLVPGGHLVALKGQRAAAELADWRATDTRGWRSDTARVVTVGELDQQTQVVVVTRDEDTEAGPRAPRQKERGGW